MKNGVSPKHKKVNIMRSKRLKDSRENNKKIIVNLNQRTRNSIFYARNKTTSSGYDVTNEHTMHARELVVIEGQSNIFALITSMTS